MNEKWSGILIYDLIHATVESIRIHNISLRLA